MAMQVSPLLSGSAPAAVSRDFFQESRPPTPAELKAAARQLEESLPGGGESRAEVRRSTETLERISLAFDRRLKFEIDRESDEILVKVIDNETDKVIKVLPPEELQRLNSRIEETIGFLFDTRV